MANTFITSSSFRDILFSRVNLNTSLMSLLESFYSDAVPTVNNFKIDGQTPASIFDGTIYRSSTLGTLFIKDDLNHQNNPFYSGNFTRNGLGYILEENIIALEANIANRERGEIIITPSPNTRVYVKSNSSTNAYKDIGVPPTNVITGDMFKNSSILDSAVESNISVKSNSQIFINGLNIFVKDNQFFGSNSAIEILSETGNSVLGMTSNSSSGIAIVHRRNFDGLEITEPNGIVLTPIRASTYFQNGLPLSGFSTGSIMYTIDGSITSDWLYLNGDTIGNVSSGATQANVAYEELFTSLWNNVSNTYAPVSPGRGASAAADWSANKTIKLLDARGRSIIGVGTGSGLTARALGEIGGEETHTITSSEMGNHKHETNQVSPSNWVLTWPHGSTTNSYTMRRSAGSGSTTSTPRVTGPMTSNSSASAHNNMQPFIAFYTIIKV